MDTQGSSINKQAEEFHRRMDSTVALYQRAIICLSADRMLRDLERLNRPSEFDLVLDRSRRLIGRACTWILNEIGQTRTDAPKTLTQVGIEEPTANGKPDMAQDISDS